MTDSKSSPVHWVKCWYLKNSHPHPTNLDASRGNRREPHNSLALCPSQLKYKNRIEKEDINKQVNIYCIHHHMADELCIDRLEDIGDHALLL